eukprot:6204994-Pleurochrysis_carterae.AAC.2
MQADESGRPRHLGSSAAAAVRRGRRRARRAHPKVAVVPALVGRVLEGRRADLSTAKGPWTSTMDVREREHD